MGSCEVSKGEFLIWGFHVDDKKKSINISIVCITWTASTWEAMPKTKFTSVFPFLLAPNGSALSRARE